MKVKEPKSKTEFADRLWHLVSKRSFVWSSIVFVYHVLIISLVVSLFYKEVPYKRRQNILGSLNAKVSQLNFFKLWNQNEGEKYQLESLNIDLDVDQLHMLEQQYLTLGADRSVYREEVPIPASIRYDNIDYKVELHIQRAVSFYGLKKPYSFDIKTLDGQNILGSTHFFIHPPSNQNYLHDWLSQRIFCEAGFPGQKKDFIEVSINSQSPRIYVLESATDGQLSKSKDDRSVFVGFDDLLFRNSYNKNSTEVLKSVTDNRDKALLLLEEFQKSERDVSQAFDLNKLATYYSLIDLLGLHDSEELNNIQFKYDSVREVLVPAMVVEGQLQSLEKYQLIGAGRQIDYQIDDNTFSSKWDIENWRNLLFSDSAFFRAYLRSLEEVVEGDFFRRMEIKYAAEMREKSNLLINFFPANRLDPFVVLAENQLYIRKALMPSRQIHPYFDRKNSNGELLCFDVTNIHFLPVEILGASIGDTVFFRTVNGADLIQSNIVLSPPTHKEIYFDVPAEFEWSDTLLMGFKVQFRIPGTSRQKSEGVINYSIIDEELLANDFIRRKPNIADFDFLNIDEEGKEIIILEGTHQVGEDLIIPENYRVFARPGANVDIINHSNILSYSPIEFIGSASNPIRIFSSDSSSQGLILLDCAEESQLEYVNFDNISNPDKAGWSVTSAITFYQSPVKITNCIFHSNRGGDDYLNVVRSNYFIESSVFINSVADAFDGDFCTGTIKNTRFINSGNDAIDISGSNLKVDQVFIERAGDKGMSAGEKSFVEAKDLEIVDTEIAITSKDLSDVRLSNISITDCRIAYAAFQKKSEYGPAIIQIEDNSVIIGKSEINYLIETGSQLRIGGQDVRPSVGMSHVKRILYGVKFGKSSG